MADLIAVPKLIRIIIDVKRKLEKKRIKKKNRIKII